MQAVRWDDLTKLPWLTSDVYCPFQEMIERCFAEHRLDYQRVVQTSDEATKLELVSAGVGLTSIERGEAYAAAQAGKLMVCETASMSCDLSVAYARSRADAPLIRAVVSEVTRVWQEPS